MYLSEKSKRRILASSKRSTQPIVYQTRSLNEYAELKEYLQGLLRENNSKNFIEIQKIESKAISIDQVRELKSWLTTRTKNAKDTVERIALIADLQSSADEAQTALLKLLEEPVPGTLVVGQATTLHGLFGTLLSRCVVIKSHNLSSEELKTFCDARDLTTEDYEQIVKVTAGDPYFVELFYDHVQHKQDSKLGKAKQFLASDAFTRLSSQKSYDSSSLLDELLASLKFLCSSALATSTSNTKDWVARLQLLLRLEHLLQRNVSPKIVYLELSTNL